MMGPELLLLHALPLDGSMWADQMALLPAASHAPTLYGLGRTVEQWAAAALKLVKGDRLIVVGCSIGGSCAIEVAAAAPDRVAALVLIGTKAGHRPDPELHAVAIQTLKERGIAESWRIYWEPLFSNSVDPGVISKAKRMALAQTPEALARGVTGFHRRPSRGDFLSTFARPVIVVSGADDIAPGPKICAAQAEMAPAGTLHVIPECGHYVPLEQPERLNAILRPLIAAQRG
jgi:pimeloyl-[acyl-carrier protein] methyl ester esterase